MINVLQIYKLYAAFWAKSISALKRVSIILLRYVKRNLILFTYHVIILKLIKITVITQRSRYINVGIKLGTKVSDCN